MFTKTDVINTITQEHAVIKHLASKVTTPEQLTYRPNDAQRSLEELLKYITHMSSSIITMLINKGYNPESTKAQQLSLENLNVLVDFDSTFDAQLPIITDYISNLTEDEMAEPLDLFRNGIPMPLNGYLMMMLRQYPAYRMQLFQYLKSGLGMTDLNTMNVWMGKDKPSQE